MIVFDVEKVYSNMSTESLHSQREACLQSQDRETCEVIDRLLKERKDARV